jgi:hypothetical protein
MHLASLALVEANLAEGFDSIQVLEGMEDKVPYQRQKRLIKQMQRVALLGRNIEIHMGP